MAKASVKGKAPVKKKKSKAPAKAEKNTAGAKDLSTEEKIKVAARKIFTQKGFAATRTRDIAEEAGINLALLNYYFRSKEKLFDLVMKENMQLFLGNMVDYLNQSPLPFMEQMEFVCSSYIDMLLENPNLPFFVMNQLQSGAGKKEDLTDPLFQKLHRVRSVFLASIKEEVEKGRIKPIHPLHFIANLMGLIVFPFIGKPILMARAGMTDHKEFEALMRERKKLVPEWIRAMLTK